MIRRLRGQKGFTLIEILIVLAVLAVLAAVVIPNVSGFLGRGKERGFDTDRRLLQAAVDAWRTDIGSRAGNPFPTVGGVKGDPTDNSGPVDGDYVDAGDVNSVIKVSLLTAGNYLKGNDVVRSFHYGPSAAQAASLGIVCTQTFGATGDTGAANTPLGSYLWYLDTNYVVQGKRWNDANNNCMVDAGELAASPGVAADVYP